MALTAHLHTCNHCGKGGLMAEQTLYSYHTRMRYCRDLDRCMARAKRARARRKAVAA